MKESYFRGKNRRILAAPKPLLLEISCSDVQKLPRFLYGRMRSGAIAGRHSEGRMPLSRTDCLERAKRLGNMVQWYGAFLLCPPLLHLPT